MGEIGAEIGRGQSAEIVERRELAEMALQKAQEGSEVATVAVDAVRRGTLFVAQPVEPGDGGVRDRVVAGEADDGRGRGNHQSGKSSQARMVCSIAWTRNVSSSVPWPGWNTPGLRAP